MLTRALSRLLWLANASPPTGCRREFYAVKDAILRRWGRPDGHDWQEITHYCWRCEGGGIVDDGWGEDDRCPKCGGTGIWDRFWVRLERWEIGGRVFHRPAERVWGRPDEPVAIVGRVEHARVGWAGQEAGLWLLLLFDRAAFAREMTSGWPRGPTLPYPLVTLRRATGRLGMLRSKFRRRRCSVCGRPFRQGLRRWRSHTYLCGPCDRRPRPRDDEIPF